MAQQWEFVIEAAQTSAELYNALKELGEQGWELVSVIVNPKDQGFLAFLKQPIRSGG